MNRNNEDDLQAAYELICEFRDGHITAGATISERQIGLLKLLRVDLLPNEAELDNDLQMLALRVGEEDIRWNRKAMEVIDAIYSLRGSGQEDESSSLQQAFFSDCPSQWYRDIVAAV